MNKRYKILKKLFGGKYIELKKTMVVLVLLLGITFVVLNNGNANVKEMEKQLENNLADVARQNALILDSRIQGEYELLLSLSKELKGITEDEISDKLSEFEIFREDFDFKRFAFCFTDGTTYSTDGQITDLSFRNFFMAGLEGKCYITGVLVDALREEHDKVNVMTVPIKDDSGNITGVFGVAYDTELFNESLQIDSFKGQGYSCIINETGEIVAVIGDNNLEVSNNLIDSVLKADERNVEFVESLKEIMEDTEDGGGGTFYLDGKNYYYCVPVNLMGGCVAWHILTIIPSDVLSERVSPIQMNQYKTVFWVCVLVGIGAFSVILLLKTQHKQMIQLAYTDSLTGGPAFAKFCTDMEKRHNYKGYMVALDINNFNNIMIAAGKAVSDTMIKETWNIISEALYKDEFAGHVRDDIFVMFLSAPDKETLIKRIEQISSRISMKAKEDVRVYGIQACYGIYVMTEKESIDSAYSKAKLAKGYAALNPECNYAFYSEVDRVKTQRDNELEERFEEAIAGKEFEVWYQPKYSADNQIIVGSEALVRWRNADGSMVSPGEFIPLFERNGMIMKLDEYMFREVCRQQRKWLNEGKKIYPVSVNISRASLYYIDLEQRYSDIMSESDIKPEYIQIEVTETIMEERQEIYDLLNKFRKMGIKILMDDFGKGASSLATLNTQCFDTLKIDKTLIDYIGNKDGETLLYHVIKMGQQMGLKITAEGVETEMQVKFLQNLNCDDIQGFYFSRPLPRTEYEKMLTN